MPKPPRPWTVVRHGPLEQLDDNLHAVEGDVPGLPGFTRRMAIVRLASGGLLFYNAVPVDDVTLDRIRGLGRPEVLVVPHHLHALDARPFREKLGLRAYGPVRPKARALVEARVPLDGSFDDLPPDPSVRVLAVAGFNTGEGLLVVRTGDRTSFVVADVVTQVPHGTGFMGLLGRVLGFTSDRPILPTPPKMRVLRDKPALRAQLEELAGTPGLVRIVTSHGRIVDRDPAGALREIARSL